MQTENALLRIRIKQPSHVLTIKKKTTKKNYLVAIESQGSLYIPRIKELRVNLQQGNYVGIRLN